MQTNGVDSSILIKLGPSKDSTAAESAANEPVKINIKLKDMKDFARDFRMLRMGYPKEAVTQFNHGRNPSRHPVTPPRDTNESDSVSELLLKYHKVYAKHFKRLKKEELTEGAAHQKKMAYTADVRAMDLGGVPFFRNCKKRLKLSHFCVWTHAER
ncbi:hypothetical protein PsorP6_009929 [Peronosclerospora sorghi]|uniref:Uncharacterized protein n=1 Tax=Peronosclerospora sorghi TaxID=230839 RepID=A0ACC0VXQ4_9STRA|nr:hypothetical protein PsorP6_009929 [Peronosclerospora sorghi]